MEKLLLASLNDLSKNSHRLEASDLEIEDLFDDSKSMGSFSRELIKKGTAKLSKKDRKAENKDVDLDDIMKASVATDFDMKL